jgi:alkanesulfonate monooxygenase SsuD/methylene tetrahydromethanopterin reductase-like flavin-dependent oxidoreductase (luciferase family)
VRDACRAGGRDPADLVFSHAITVCCGESEGELERRARAIGRELDDLRRNAAGGTPPEVTARLLEYADAGAERAYLQVIDLDDLDHVALIAAEVLPKLAGS